MKVKGKYCGNGMYSQDRELENRGARRELERTWVEREGEGEWARERERERESEREHVKREKERA